MTAVVVRAGLAAAERMVIDYPERREVTRQFPAPVLDDHTADEFAARLSLAFRQRDASEVARARLSIVMRLYDPKGEHASQRKLLRAFDAQNAAVLGHEVLL